MSKLNFNSLRHEEESKSQFSRVQSEIGLYAYNADSMQGFRRTTVLRRLAAIDMLFLGPKFIIGEYLAGVAFCAALGIFTLERARSAGSRVLGAYLLCLALNYVPMLIYAVAIRTRERAAAELGGELNDKRGALAKYRRVSLLLLVPLAAPVLAFGSGWMQTRQRD